MIAALGLLVGVVLGLIFTPDVPSGLDPYLPIAVVAALRETSVLFGAVIAVVVLKEPLRASRVVAALLIVAGLALIRLY